MKAVIPCALKEDSLFPMIESKPTALMPIMGKPVIEHLIENLRSLDVEEIYLVANYMEDELRSEFGDKDRVRIVRQEELNGTGGAVETCSSIEDDFLVVNGDVMVSKRDLESLVEKHCSKDSSVTVLADMDEKPEKFGVLSIRDDKITGLVEKPEKAENSLINTGIYVFKPEIFDYLSDMEGEKDLTDAVQRMIDDQTARFEIIEDYWIDIGSPKRLWEADRRLRQHSINKTEIDDEAEIHDNVEIVGDAFIEEGAELKPGTVIEGKVFVGSGSTVGPNTTLKNCTVSSECQIRSSDIEKSVLFEEVITDPSVHLEDTVIAEECDINSNTTIRQSFIGPRSFIEMNNSIRGVKFVPDARTDLGEISK